MQLGRRLLGLLVKTDLVDPIEAEAATDKTQSKVGSGEILVAEHVSDDIVDSPVRAQGLVAPLIGAELLKEVDEVKTLLASHQGEIVHDSSEVGRLWRLVDVRLRGEASPM